MQKMPGPSIKPHCIMQAALYSANFSFASACKSLACNNFFLNTEVLIKNPAAGDFWRIYSVVCQKDFTRIYNAYLDQINRKIKKLQALIIDPEASRIMRVQKQESLLLNAPIARVQKK